MRKRGFTLIELLIVIAIVAIMAAVVLIAVSPGRQMAQARNAERRSEVNALLNALNQYQIDHGGLAPSCIATTNPRTVCPAGVACDCPEDGTFDIAPRYIADVPTRGAPTEEWYRAWTTSETPPYRINVDAPGAELGETISVTR